MIVGMLPRLACIEATDSHTREEGKDGKMCGQSRNTSRSPRQHAAGPGAAANRFLSSVLKRQLGAALGAVCER